MGVVLSSLSKQIGFGKSWDPSKDIPNLTGKVALVTGGNAGIGAAIVEGLATNGAKVYMGARSEERAKAAIKKIEDAHPGVKEKGLVVWLPLDLTEPEDVVKSAKDFMSREKRLDIVVNNAARMASDFELTKHGIELSVAINHFGHFVLVQQLMPVLKSTAMSPGSDTRIVVVSSEGYRGCPKLAGLKTLEQLNAPYHGYQTAKGFYARVIRYAYTKLLNQLYKIELQRRLNAENSSIVVISVMPGMVATRGSFVTYPWWLKPIFHLFTISATAGAVSALFAATSPEVRQDVEKYKAAYLTVDGSVLKTTAQATDPKLAEDLWGLSEEIVGEIMDGKM
ncbi:hypothetical protein MMC11_003706 [Xylographa trunciseda]|nr:hypothetical protein [Xylographa trunciseda]